MNSCIRSRQSSFSCLNCIISFTMEKADVDMENEDFIDVETPDIVTQDVPSIASSSQVTINEPEDSNSLPEEIVGKPPEIYYDSIGEFCFESDELALKGNTDYKNVLEAMVVLEAQKAKAIKDLEGLKKLQAEALSDPFEFLERLKRKENMNFPAPQKIYPIPVIDWSKYAVCGNPSAFCQRQITLISSKVAEGLSSSKTKLNDFLNDESRVISQPWTLEEEKHLKELLIEFPEDENKTERWEKISSFLENRTPTEVATKAQLFAMGIEDDKHSQVPGALKNKNRDEKHVIYSEIESLNSEISPDLQDSPEYQELILLNKVLREKLDSTSLSQHKGYKCCRCKAEPIVGVRWHCIDCRPPLSTDFCNECKDCYYETRQHTTNHRIERIHASKALLDRDYMHFIGSDYNYLDPNYMPAT